MPSIYPPSYPPTWQVPTPLLQRRQVSAATSIRGVTWSYSALAHDFAIDGTGNVALTDAAAAAVQWAAKATTTQRGAHLIYGRNFGVDIRRCLRAGNHQAVENALTAEMRRSVKRDIRISDLTDFSFRWTDTRLQVAYTVVLANGQRKQTFVQLGIT
jgi:hypothetical protein